MFYPDMSHIWNSDTEGKYPDPDRTTRLDSIRSGRIGGFTADSLAREQVRRDYYEYVILPTVGDPSQEREREREHPFSLHGISDALLKSFLDSKRDNVHQEIPEGSGETPLPSRSSGDPEIQGFPAPQSTIKEIHRLLRPYQRPLSEES